MLLKMRHVALRLRYGVVALAIFAPLAVPATASAVVSTNPPASPQPVTYDNLANATAQRNFYYDPVLAYQLDQGGSPSSVNASNQAVALTDNCRDCGALAIAFQVVFVSDQDLTGITAYNNADATSYSCVRCNNMAEAYQIIVATDQQSQLTPQQRRGLDLVHARLQSLLRFGFSPGLVQRESNALANQAVSIVDNPDYGLFGQGALPGGPFAGAAVVSPAINGSDLSAEMTESTQPIVDLYVDVKVST
jgi:putative peptide zinc metalloprotease protein